MNINSFLFEFFFFFLITVLKSSNGVFLSVNKGGELLAQYF